MSERIERKRFFTRLGVWGVSLAALLSSPMRLFGKESGMKKKAITVRPNPLAVKRKNTGV